MYWVVLNKLDISTPSLSTLKFAIRVPTCLPLFYAENKRKPPLTSIIAGASSAMTADDVAKKALDGIKASRFFVTCNSMGQLLSIATAGMSPQRSLRMAVIEVLSIGVTRLVALFVQWDWYKSIHKWHAANKEWPVSWGPSLVITIGSSERRLFLILLNKYRWNKKKMTVPNINLNLLRFTFDSFGQHCMKTTWKQWNCQISGHEYLFSFIIVAHEFLSCSNQNYSALKWVRLSNNLHRKKN